MQRKFRKSCAAGTISDLILFGKGKVITHKEALAFMHLSISLSSPHLEHRTKVDLLVYKGKNDS